MSLHRERDLKSSARKCALCDRVAEGEVWGHWLCFEHVGDWHRQCPGAERLATESDVELRRPRAFGGPDIVVLKRGAEARLLESWTRGWVQSQRRGAA